ncbi:MAG: prepilin-type N-terminal cleavage/methylation domain-containing protein [Planctomycetota bacterium]|jgi:prepilin-type N-terminal cleavage/methylation domain-containing protein
MRRSTTSRRRISSRASRRGLTLLEILIALAVLAVIAALAWPTLDGRLEERAFTSAADVTVQQLLLARAWAQSSGTPVEVIHRPGSRRVEAHVVDLARRRAAATTGPPDDGRDDDPRLDADARGPDTLIAEAWALRVLPAGVRLGDDDAPSDDAPWPEDAPWPDDGPGPDPDATRRLALFLPDGSALPTDAVELHGEDGRRGVLAVSPWTGLPTFTRAGPADADAPDVGRDGADPDEPFDPWSDLEADAALGPGGAP